MPSGLKIRFLKNELSPHKRPLDVSEGSGAAWKESFRFIVEQGLMTAKHSSLSAVALGPRAPEAALTPTRRFLPRGGYLTFFLEIEEAFVAG